MNKKNQQIMMASLVLMATGTMGASAASIVNAGSLSDNAGGQLVGWRDNTVAKTMDISGDNIYGSLGAIVWGDGDGSSSHLTAAGMNLTSGLSGAGVLGWSFIGQTVNPDLGIGLQGFVHSGFQQINNLAGTGLLTPGVGSISPGNGTFTFQLNGVAGDYLGQTVRVGFMQDYQESTAINDGNKLFRLEQVAGPGLASFTTPLTPNHIGDMYFWDITGVNPGDQFTITGFANPAATGQGGLASLGSISFDIAAVPEPAAGSLIMLGAVAFHARRRPRNSFQLLCTVRLQK